MQSIARLSLTTQPMAYVITPQFWLFLDFNWSTLRPWSLHVSNQSSIASNAWFSILRTQSLMRLNPVAWVFLLSSHAYIVIAMKAPLASLMASWLRSSSRLVTHPNWKSRTISHRICFNCIAIVSQVESSTQYNSGLGPSFEIRRVTSLNHSLSLVSLPPWRFELTFDPTKDSDCGWR